MLGKIRIFVLVTLLASFTYTVSAAVSIGDIQCESLRNPIGIDARNPRFSWRIFAEGERNVMQRSYRILVASSQQKLDENSGDMWDSGVVNSDQSQWIRYEGKPLESNTYYYWKVLVTTNTGNPVWSGSAFWCMGLLSENDWRARWIGMDRGAKWDVESQFSRLSARYLRKEFQVDKPVKQAVVHISGLGLYELFLNGNRVGNQVLAPAPTDYRQTLLYNSYDVTSMLQVADNAIGVTLGNGRYYTMRQAYKPYKIPTFGYPKLRLTFIIDYTDGTREVIGSDTSWKMTADGPIRSNNEYDGEEYDARKELTGWNKAGYDDSYWEDAERVSIPYGTLRAQMMEGMKVVDTIDPLSITELSPGKHILDMGQNMVGWIRFKVQGNAGDMVKLRFAETLQPDGNLYMDNLRDAKVTDTYILKGDGIEEWAPRFVYHGFRYVEVTGYPGKVDKKNFTGEVVNDEMVITGSFESSDPVINQVMKNAFWGIRGNYKGMPVDCPQRNERQPWLGDRIIGGLGESYLFENVQMYSKWMDDIREAQREDGCIPDVAPAFWNYYSDNVTWPSAFFFNCDMLYTQFGNQEPIEKNYESMLKWVRHMKGEYMTEDYLMPRDKYGDWCVPPESPEQIHARDPRRLTDGALIGTAYYYRILRLMKKFALLQDKQDDAAQFDALSDKVKAAFNDKFFRTDSLFYGNNTATANLLPLAFGMIPEEWVPAVENHLVTGIMKNNNYDCHIPTGVIGSQWILREFSKMGRADIAFRLASNDTYPSWGYMAKQGATTIWELWNGDTARPEMNSGNHVMLLGDFIPFCYENMAGIKSDDELIAFKKIIMRPHFDIQDLSYVNASYKTPYGDVKSYWKKDLERLEWIVSVPPNSTAVVHFPANSFNIREGDVALKTGNGIKELGRDENAIIWEMGSGDYNFTMELDPGYEKWRKGIVEEKFLYETAPFPECHAATIAETPEGLVAAFFGGTKERNPDVEIWVSRMVNGEWTAPESVANGIISDTLRKACWNPVLFQVPGEELLLFYKIGSSVSDWTGHLIRSFDHGKTWTEPEELPEGFIGPVKNKPVMIGSRMICPSSLEGAPGWRVHFEITEDKGKTWRKVGAINDGKAIRAIQPSILTYQDGSLQILARTRDAALAEAWSKEGGETWGEMTLSGLPNNNSGTDAVTLRDGRQLLVYNHVKPTDRSGKGPRTPLNVALSDDGKAWYASLILEDSPVSQYSYPSVIQGEDGYVHIVYTWRRQRIKYVKIDPAKLERTPIQNEAWPY
ncbi:Alpha-L-rhamnosidase [Proteiniphilum saccharofermentans]|uniref:alpha-L-rhamnosidase n=1 Tax=Proteiniphilum saccharofermentans TaxID=1642647 RepID=A0A1R3T182_9BACT|nr:family 78 glycoside hydrolase catalytic domain [Proteiniphilum saccharofermentans]SCD21501.1 Alpha-L-rhamnosidase [Proteiniphilum saccharofermentans]